MVEKTQLETLKARMDKIKADIANEEGRLVIESKTEAIQVAVHEALTGLIDEMPTTHGLWVVNNGKGDVLVSIMQARDDGMPKAQATKSGNVAGSNGNGSNSEYVLEDNRVFDNCEKAVNALGIETRDSEGNWLEGKKYYGRLDRLPKEVAAKITKREKVVTEPENTEKPETSENGNKPETEVPATS